MGVKVHAQLLGSNVLLPRRDWERLLGMARRSGDVEVSIEAEEVSTASLMGLVDQGGAFDFWRDQGEDVYTVEDGEAV